MTFSLLITKSLRQVVFEKALIFTECILQLEVKKFKNGFRVTNTMFPQLMFFEGNLKR